MFFVIFREDGRIHMEELTIEQRKPEKRDAMKKYADLVAIVIACVMIPFAILAADRLLAL